MKVKLISTTQNLLDILYTGARTCYNAGSPIDMFEEVGNIPPDKKLKLINGCIKSNHQSILEHSQFTFAIEGVSRSLMAQITRHRVGVSFSIQSQRYVEIKEDQDYLADLYTDLDTEDYINSELCHILDKYFVDAHKFKNLNGYYFALDNYLEAIKMGDKPEEARRFLPNATKTELYMCGFEDDWDRFFDLRDKDTVDPQTHGLVIQLHLQYNVLIAETEGRLRKSETVKKLESIYP